MKKLSCSCSAVCRLAPKVGMCAVRVATLCPLQECCIELCATSCHACSCFWSLPAAGHDLDFKALVCLLTQAVITCALEAPCTRTWWSAQQMGPYCSCRAAALPQHSPVPAATTHQTCRCAAVAVGIGQTAVKLSRCLLKMQPLHRLH